jgi:hypothetical protein
MASVVLAGLQLGWSETARTMARVICSMASIYESMRRSLAASRSIDRIFAKPLLADTLASVSAPSIQAGMLRHATTPTNPSPFAGLNKAITSSFGLRFDPERSPLAAISRISAREINASQISARQVRPLLESYDKRPVKQGVFGELSKGIAATQLRVINKSLASICEPPIQPLTADLAKSVLGPTMKVNKISEPGLVSLFTDIQKSALGSPLAGLSGSLATIDPLHLEPLSKISSRALMGLGLDRAISDIASMTLRERLPDLSSILRGPLMVHETFDKWTEFFRRRDAIEAQLDPEAKRLLFVLDHMGFGHAMQVMELMVEKGIDPLIDLLGQVLLDDDFLVQIDELLAEAAPLRETVRQHLRHGIEHLRAGEFHHAGPPLVTGLEGALRDGARQRSNKKIPNAESAIMIIEFEQPQDLFLRQVVYSPKHANNVRHGEDVDPRAMSVLALVALLLWLEKFSSLSMMIWLGRTLGSEFQGRLTRV